MGTLSSAVTSPSCRRSLTSSHTTHLVRQRRTRVRAVANPGAPPTHLRALVAQCLANSVDALAVMQRRKRLRRLRRLPARRVPLPQPSAPAPPAALLPVSRTRRTPPTRSLMVARRVLQLRGAAAVEVSVQPRCARRSWVRPVPQVRRAAQRRETAMPTVVTTVTAMPPAAARLSLSSSCVARAAELQLARRRCPSATSATSARAAGASGGRPSVASSS